MTRVLVRESLHPPALLEVQGLRVELADGSDIVSEIDLRVHAGEIVALVGESGSGKSTVAATLLGHTRTGARVSAGSVRVDGVDMLHKSARELRKSRGRLVSYVPQDPATALNPLRRIETQLAELLEVHEPGLDRAARTARIEALLREVGLPAEREFLRRFPHQLSGGQQQRVLLCLAFLLRPRLVVLDEPTTALDVVTQAKILTLVRELCLRHGAAALYVSHDLLVVQQLADRVVVLYGGRIVESAPRSTLFREPRHPYTRALLAAIPDGSVGSEPRPIPGLPPAPRRRPPGCAFAPRCVYADDDVCGAQAPRLQQLSEAHQVACFFPLHGAASRAPAQPRAADAARPTLLEAHALSAGYANRRVLERVELRVRQGECVALVGESGSGKTTLVRTLAGLGEHAQGTLLFDGKPLPLAARARTQDARGAIQYVFQNPYRALNPRRSVRQTLLAALRSFHSEPDEQRCVLDAMKSVALSPSLADVLPRSLSGGECQRVAIARALICRPRLLICDEITSALDVSVQATILQLLRQLQRDGLAILFVTHDLGVVGSIANQVAVLRDGRVVETGDTRTVLEAPADTYTRALLAHSPSLQAI